VAGVIRLAYGRAMDEFVQKMVDKVGIDKATAMKVIDFLKDHADEAVQYLQKSGVADKLPGGLGDKLGKLF
jgi:hypothetical protein